MFKNENVEARSVKGKGYEKSFYDNDIFMSVNNCSYKL